MNGVITSVNPDGSGSIQGFNPPGNFFFAPGQLLGPAHPGSQVTFGLQQVLGPFGTPTLVAVHVQPTSFGPMFVQPSMMSAATFSVVTGGADASAPDLTTTSGNALLLTARAAEAAARAAQAAAEAAQAAAQSLLQLTAAAAGTIDPGGASEGG